MAGIDDIARASGVKKDVIKDVFEAVLQLVNEDQPVRVTGFGTFERRQYSGRTLVSPRVNDGKPMAFKDSYVLRFRQSQVAKTRLNISAPPAKKAKASAEAPAEKPAKAAKAQTPAPEKATKKSKKA